MEGSCSVCHTTHLPMLLPSLARSLLHRSRQLQSDRTTRRPQRKHTCRCSPIGQERDVHRQSHVLWVHQVVAGGCSWGQQVVAGRWRPWRLQACLPASTLHILQAACQAGSVSAEDGAFLVLVVYPLALAASTVSHELWQL